MKVILADKIGFCFGVKRAVKMAEAALGKNSRIYSLGSIIHNRQVVDGLETRGLKVIKDINQAVGGTLVISSHGLSPKTAKKLTAKGIKIIDTTCPFVLNAQRIAKFLSDEGYAVIIAGDADHPEVKALVGFVSGDVFVVKNGKEASSLKLKRAEKIGIISQTTQSTGNFLDVVKAVFEKGPKEVRIFNTICRDTEDRQLSASRLAKRADLMLIVGGKDSANTRRLFEVCNKLQRNSHHIEAEGELDRGWLEAGQVVGIASGASTPDWVVKRVVGRISRISKQKT